MSAEDPPPSNAVPVCCCDCQSNSPNPSLCLQLRNSRPFLQSHKAQRWCRVHRDIWLRVCHSQGRRSHFSLLSSLQIRATAPGVISLAIVNRAQSHARFPPSFASFLLVSAPLPLSVNLALVQWVSRSCILIWRCPSLSSTGTIACG